MLPEVSLRAVTKADLIQVREWLSDPEVNQMWYGCDDSSQPLHTGYDLGFNDDETADLLTKLSGDRNRDVISVLSESEGHIGEAQLVYEWPPRSTALFTDWRKRIVAPSLRHSCPSKSIGLCVPGKKFAQSMGRRA